MPDLFAAPHANATSNIPELSVSDLSSALKRTLEDAFGRVRVRGELSKVSFPASGHMYSALKDDASVIDAVCWRTQLPRLKIRPEEGLEVICTGRITTYAARSSYQLIIEQMELAGVGAILKMIEDRRVKLAAEGLFDAGRKRPLPILPRVIGVVTSPTGAVIRDILHRLSDRFPVHVIVWPVSVQGERAATEVATAINGFSALPTGGPIPRPDVVIVARGGGSIEDLMPFNEEIVVRAAAGCTIPLISAVGHETDTTLIDYASDARAPTPTAAAEFAVPVRDDLLYTVQTYHARLGQALSRQLREQRSELTALAARLGEPNRLLEMPMQKLDHLSANLSRGLSVKIERARSKLGETAARLIHPARFITEQKRLLTIHVKSLLRLGGNITVQPKERLSGATRLLETLSFHQVLARGFALVRDEKGVVVRRGQDLAPHANVNILFGDHVTKTAKIDH